MRIKGNHVTNPRKKRKKGKEKKKKKKKEKKSLKNHPSGNRSEKQIVTFVNPEVFHISISFYPKNIQRPALFLFSHERNSMKTQKRFEMNAEFS